MNCKHLISFLVLAATALAAAPLSIDAPQQNVDVNQGEVAKYFIEIKNLGSYTQNVTLTAKSEDVLTSFTDDSFSLTPGSIKDVYLFAVTSGVASGFYPIDVVITDNAYEYDATFGVRVSEGRQAMLLTSAYGEVSLEQNDWKELKFVLRNDGKDELKNVVISGDVSEKLAPEYPGVFNLAAGEMKDIDVKITIPRDYPSGTEEFTVRAASGSTETTAKVKVTVKKTPVLKTALAIQRADVGALKQNDSTIGYSLVLRVKNAAGRDIQDVDVTFENATGWTISGQKHFDIQRFETKDLEIQLKPSTYDERVLGIHLVKDNTEMANESIVVSGAKIGMPTGMFYLGSSLTIGLLFFAVVVVVLLYVREKNKRVTTESVVREESYLQMLADRAKEQPAEEPQSQQPTIEG